MSLDLNRAANVATLVVAGCAVLATASLLGGFRRGSQTARVLPPDSVQVADWQKYLAGGHSRGPENAAVTILEFGDYECPYCARFATTIDRILAAYPDEVRFVYRHWPLPNHRFAYPAARAAECAGEQDRFWPYHDLLYAKQDSVGLITFVDLARRSDVPNMRAFEECAQRPDTVPVIQAGIRDIEAVGGTGTPTVIVNGILRRRGIDSAYVASVLARIRDR